MLQDAYKLTGSFWFRRILKDFKRISSHIHVKRIKYGFFRIYYERAYIGECYKEMPQFGHDIYEKNIHFENKKYYEKLEDKQKW